MTFARSIGSVGRKTIDAARFVGGSVLFLLEALLSAFVPPFRLRRILDQTAFIGARSVIIVLVTGLFTGMVIALQGHHNLMKHSSDSMLGALVALCIVRELGPVLASLMVAGRAGSSITAEIGIMKVTEQLNALEMMAVNPIKYVVAPKIIAGLISMPLLTAIFDIVGIIGGYVVGVLMLGVDEGAYLSSITRAMEPMDVLGGFVKSVVFGLVITWFCSLAGYRAAATTEGVTSATTGAVVVTSVTILVTDYALTTLFF